MKRFLTLIITLAIAGCSFIEEGGSPTGTDVLYTPKYARRFSLHHRGDTTILTIKDPWQGASETVKRYEIASPCRKVAALSTSHLAFLEAIGKADIVYGVSGKQYIYSKSFDKTVDIGYERHLEFERILSMKPDAMFVYEVAGESAPVFNKLESLGINVIYIADYLEPDPLGRAEWIVVFGALTGRLEEAVEYFRKVESAYLDLKNSATPTGKKVILNSPYRDTWYFPGTGSYTVRLVEDAGGEYVGKEFKGETSTPVNIETAYRLLKEADIWLNPSIGTETKEDLTKADARLTGIRIPLYNNDRRRTRYGGSDFYETGAARPDLVLKDLRTILSGGCDSLTFYREIK